MLLETDKALLGKKFKHYRKMKKMTQFKLAEKVGLNEKQISRIESGLNYPTYITFVKLIEVLEIDINYFSKDKNALIKRLFVIISISIITILVFFGVKANIFAAALYGMEKESPRQPPRADDMHFR